MEQASKTYHHLCDDEYAIYNKVSIARRSIIDAWAENFKLALDIFKDAVSSFFKKLWLDPYSELVIKIASDFCQILNVHFFLQGDEADEEEIYNVVQSLKRLSYLFMFNDLTGSTLYDTVNSVIQMYEERNDSVPEPVSFFTCEIYTIGLFCREYHLYLPCSLSKAKGMNTVTVI